MPSRAILLDALGTLLALEPPAPRLSALLRSRHGIEVDEAQAQRALRVEMRHYREQCVRAANAAALADLRTECAQILAAELGGAALAVPTAELVATLLDSLHFTAFPEVPGALARWHAQGIALVVASNWDVSLHEHLESTGLSALLDGVVTSAQVGVAKPAAALFEAALAVAGVGPPAAVHVGDNLVEDVQGATAAGIRAVWLRRPGAGASEPPPPAVAVITSLDQLVPPA